MALGIEQPAVVVLAVDFDRQGTEFAKHRRSDRRPAEEGAAAAVALERPPDDQRFTRIGLDSMAGEQHKRWMASWKVDFGGDRGGFGAGANQTAVGALSKRQSKRIKKDRFAGSGLAGQDSKAAFELERKLLDENDIADLEML